MRTSEHKAGLTLVEIVVVVGLIALLLTMIIGVISRVQSQSQEHLAQGTLELLNAALEQFRDYGYNYTVPQALPLDEKDFYRALKFPLDCNDYPFDAPPFDVRSSLMVALDVNDVQLISGLHEPRYSGIEVMYFFLSQVPTSRQTLEKITKSVKTNAGTDGADLILRTIFRGQFRDYPLIRVVDPWGTTLNYSLYENGYEDQMHNGVPHEPLADKPRNFPLVTSAGPDRIFGTDDDITNK